MLRFLGLSGILSWVFSQPLPRIHKDEAGWGLNEQKINLHPPPFPLPSHQQVINLLWNNMHVGAEFITAV